MTMNFVLCAKLSSISVYYLVSEHITWIRFLKNLGTGTLNLQIPNGLRYKIRYHAIFLSYCSAKHLLRLGAVQVKLFLDNLPHTLYQAFYLILLVTLAKNKGIAKIFITESLQLGKKNVNSLFLLRSNAWLLVHTTHFFRLVHFTYAHNQERSIIIKPKLLTAQR